MEPRPQTCKKMKAPLKVGLILDGEIVPLWVYRVIQTIRESRSGSVQVVVHSQGARQGEPAPPLAFRLYEKLDRLIFARRGNQQSMVSTAELLKGVPQISAHSVTTLYDDIPENDRPDLILNLSSEKVPRTGKTMAGFGVWNCEITGKPAVYWKMIREEAVLPVILKSYNSSFNKEMIIYRSWIAVNYNSLHQNQDHIRGLYPAIIRRLIDGIFRYGQDYFAQMADRCNEVGEQREIRSFPGNFMVIKNILRIFSRFLYRRIYFKNSWNWFLLFKKDNQPLSPASGSYLPLIPPPDRFWADPFIVSGEKENFVFVEELLFRKKVGHISLLKLNEDGKLLDSEKILEKPYHLSYPSVFSYQNKYYMIPETAGNKTIELYESTDFPGKWKFMMNLMENISARDTTPFFYRNKWWLFTSINEYPEFDGHEELFLFYANDLFTTKWISHPLNPVVTDIRTARPAGRIFIHDHKIYRPSQDCSVRYGKAFSLNRITDLTTSRYAEVMVTKAEATWQPALKGTHTFNYDGDNTVIDVYRFRKRFIHSPVTS